jgi:hypothetical protein
MRTTFVRALVVAAAVQFIATRARAGRVRYEGEAEALWAQYPLVVIANALTWTIVLALADKLVSSFRRTRTG